jgi:hypothetical protein
MPKLNENSVKTIVFDLRKPTCMKRAGRCCFRKHHIFDGDNRSYTDLISLSIAVVFYFNSCSLHFMKL